MYFIHAICIIHMCCMYYSHMLYILYVYSTHPYTISIQYNGYIWHGCACRALWLGVLGGKQVHQALQSGAPSQGGSHKQVHRCTQGTSEGCTLTLGRAWARPGRLSRSTPVHWAPHLGHIWVLQQVKQYSAVLGFSTAQIWELKEQLPYLVVAPAHTVYSYTLQYTLHRALEYCAQCTSKSVFETFINISNVKFVVPILETSVRIFEIINLLLTFEKM